MNKEFWKAALIRAVRTVAQVLGASIPVDIPITVTMVKGLDINVLWAILAWLATGLLSGLASILTSIATGLPEVERGEDRHPPDEGDDNEEQSFQELIRGKYREDYLRNVKALLKSHEEQSNSPDDEDDDNEESCPVTVKAYDDYYEDGTPKEKGGVIFPEAIDEDGEDNADH